MSERLMWKMKPVDEMSREDLLIVVYEMAKLMKADEERYKKRLKTLEATYKA